MKSTKFVSTLAAALTFVTLSPAHADDSSVELEILKKNSSGQYLTSSKDGLPEIVLSEDKESGEGVFLDLRNSNNVPSQYRKIFFSPAVGPLNPTYSAANVVLPPRDWAEIACSGIDKRGTMFNHNKKNLSQIVSSIRLQAGTNAVVTFSQHDESPNVKVLFPQRRDLGSITFHDYGFYKNNLEPAVNVDLKGKVCPGGY